MSRQMLFLLLALMMFASCSRDNESTESQATPPQATPPAQHDTYSAEFMGCGGSLVLPLWIPVEEVGDNEIYHNWKCGIFIESITADGNPIQAQDHHVLYYSIDFGSIHSPSPWHGYLVSADFDKEKDAYVLICMSYLKKPEWEFVEYLIPVDTQVIEIKYRPRYPSSEMGEEFCVTVNESVGRGP